MSQKQQITRQEFEKKVEIESANLQHYNHMSKADADKEALAYISEKYEIG